MTYGSVCDIDLCLRIKHDVDVSMFGNIASSRLGGECLSSGEKLSTVPCLVNLHVLKVEDFAQCNEETMSY